MNPNQDETNPPPLETHNLSVSYHGKPVLYGIDVTIPQGNLIGILGPNGAGKSTFVKAVMGLIPLSGGWVKVFGGSLREHATRVAYVPQRESVDWDFPISVMEVVLMGRYGKLRLTQRPSKQDREVARACLEKVGMLSYADRQIGALSGGQQQRVFLARALAQEGDLYLMDEPFVGVDAATEKAVIDLLRELKEMGKTVMVVHHDFSTVRNYFDQLMLLNMRLVAFGSTREVFTAEILQKTYGGKLSLLTEAAEAMRQNP